MPARALAFVLVLVLVAGCTRSEPAFPEAPYAFPSAASEAPRIARIEGSIKIGKRTTTLAEAMEEHRARGVSAAVMVGGRVVWARGWGWADAERKARMRPETVLQAASVSKPMTAVAVMRMVERRELDLGVDIARYVEGWDARWDGRHAAITLEQLLSHTSGLNVHGFGGYAAGTRELPSTLDILDGRGNSPRVKLVFEPGTSGKYSGGGFTVVQAAVEATTGDPFATAMYDWLIEPFHLTHSTFEQPIGDAHVAFAATAYQKGVAVDGRWHVYPTGAAAGLWTTPTDLLTVAGALVDAYAGRPSPIARATVVRMLTPVRGTWGLGWQIERHEEDGREVLEASHGGVNVGFTSSLRWRTDGYGVAVMVNGDGSLTSALAQAIAEEYGWRHAPSDDRAQ